MTSYPVVDRNNPKAQSASAEYRKGGHMTVAGRIREKLTENLAPSRLNVVDDSHKHAGHVGARPEGETHFSVEIVSTSFIASTGYSVGSKVLRISPQRSIRAPK